MITVNWSRNGGPEGQSLKVDEVFAEYGGDKPYVFFVENCFQPKIWLVMGDSFEDAYASFCLIPSVEESLAYDEAATLEVPEDDRQYNDNGVHIDHESIMGFQTSWAHIVKSDNPPIY